VSLALVVLPAAGLHSPIDEDQTTFGQVFRADFTQTAPGIDRESVGRFLRLAAVRPPAAVDR
jgi:hypothetical protein